MVQFLSLQLAKKALTRQTDRVFSPFKACTAVSTFRQKQKIELHNSQYSKKTVFPIMRAYQIQLY
jgi:hypothetical protein